MRLRFAVMAALCSFALPLFAESSIHWEPYPLQSPPAGVTAELGHLTVRLIRGQKESAPVDLAFIRLRSDAHPTGAPIVYLAGGPGDNGTGVARFPPALAAFGRLAQLGDVILLDQRGVGLSSPRPICQPEVPLTPAERFAGATLVTRLSEVAAKCAADWAAKGVDVRGFTNAESAADIHDLRVALGVSKVRLFGFSYGTHLALAVLRAYGDDVERAVLVGTEGPNDTRKLPWMLDTQLAKLSILARRDPSIGKEVPDMAATLRRILGKLEASPMIVTVRDLTTKHDVDVPVGPDAFRRILLADIGDGNDFPVFPALLATVDRGDSSILAWFVEKRYNQWTGAMRLMTLGMECSSGATAGRWEEIDREAATSLFAQEVNFLFPAVCAALPKVDLGDAFRGPLVSDVPVLFVSGTLDSNAPPYQAEELRFGMPYATHLIVANAGHEDTLPNAEVQRAIFDFMAGKDVSGRVIALPTPDFLSIEEAKRDRKR